MTNKYDNVYLNCVSTVVGPYEHDGPLSKRFDRYFKDLYMNEDSFETAEIHLMKESIDILLDKAGKKKKDINLLVAGDLQNQITSACYSALKYEVPFLGIYTACATNTEGLIIASNFIDSKKASNVVVSVSSHNMVSERQFRNPTEYGAPKPSTATFTATGGASCLLSNTKSDIKIESSTIGRVVDMEQTDPNNMGANMAAAAADTIYHHLTNLKRRPDYYDLILTGDLGTYGKEILIEYMKKEYNMDISKNYNDCGTILYDINNQKEVQAGGSGPVCSALVIYGDIVPKLRQKELKKVLYVATGALFNPTLVFQKENILSIAHAVSLEVVEWYTYIPFYLLD